MATCLHLADHGAVEWYMDIWTNTRFIPLLARQRQLTCCSRHARSILRMTHYVLSLGTVMQMQPEAPRMLVASLGSQYTVYMCIWMLRMLLLVAPRDCSPLTAYKTQPCFTVRRGCPRHHAQLRSSQHTCANPSEAHDWCLLAS